ncbi:MAG: protein translocase subunit SecD, partial [Chitinophagales bacterium]|nr:protein translocase subunit SecD [Chitinophagales bacterium]
MQGKGLVRFFLIVLTIVCLYQLSFTWVASNIENAAEDYAEKSVDPTLQGDALDEALADLKTEFLNQKSNETVYNIGIAKYNYDEVKSRALNLGLDLQGGMSVVMEVSKYDLLKSLSNNPKNPALIAALDKARADDAAGKGDIINLFQKYYEDANPGSSLVTLYKSNDNKDLPVTASNDQVISFLKEAADNGINSTYTKLKERIDKFGVASPYITLQENTGRIIIELPGVDNPKQVRKLLQSTANLQFWETYQIQDLSQNLTQANEILRTLLEEGGGTDTTIQAFTNDTLSSNDSITAPLTDTNTMLFADDTGSLLSDTGLTDIPADTSSPDAGPLINKVLLPPQGAGPVIGYVSKADTMTLRKYLNYEEVRAVFPNTIFMLSAEPIIDEQQKKTDLYEVYAVKPKLDDNAPLLEGDIIRSASQTFNPTNGDAEVTMQMNSDGAKKWRRITGDSKGNYIAIVLDNQVYSAPRVNEEIPNGNSVISGNFEVKDAQVLANILETGKLPVPSRIVQEDIVGPSLGAESIRNGILSMIAGLILVILFMAFYYSTAGIIADLALFANIFFIFGALASLGATLTLPGIAGLVLTMGMAVDANVIIYERVREELAKGKSMLKAIGDGYVNSYSAIIDANVTTILSAMVLAYFGLGPIKGFAVTLLIGVMFSLFTAVLIGRLIIEWWIGKGRNITLSTNSTKDLFSKINVDWLG